MDIGTFESEINPVIVSRGRGYHRAGRVSELEEVAPQLFHATADGTALYEIDIRMKGDRIVTAACSCPYDCGKYCKHIVAALLQLRDQRRKGEGRCGGADAKGETASSLPHDTYEAVLKYLESKRASVDLRSPKRKQKKRTQPPLSLAQAAATIEDSILDFREEWDDRWSDGRSGFSYMDNGAAMRGAYEVLGNALECDDPAQGSLLALLAFGYILQFIGGWDDSDGIAGDAMAHAQDVLGQRCEELVRSGPHMLKTQVLDALLGASANPAYGGWGAESQFLQLAADLVDDSRTARLVAAALADKEKAESFSAKGLVPAHYRLLERFDAKEAKKFAKENRLHPFFFTSQVEEAFLLHDMEKCRALLEEKTGWSAEVQGQDAKRQGQKPKAARHMAAGDHTLPREVFPDGYYTFLEAVLEEQGDREALLALYRRNLEGWSVSKGTVDKIRAISGNDWIRERDRIIEDAIQSGRHSSVAEDLIRDDGLADAALRYCKVEATCNRGVVARKSERILRFYRLVGKAYPDEARAMLEELIEAKANGVTSNEMYEEICNVVQCYMSLFGANDARKITASLRGRFARRRNLMAELDRLESSWG